MLNLLVMCTTQDSSLKFRLKLYVSTTGNDNWSGTLQQANPGKTDGPFATLWGARDAIRKLKESEKLLKGNVMVEIQGGVYELPDVFELEVKDGGIDSLSRIFYSGQEGSEVRLSGGRSLTNWKLIADQDVLDKCDPTVRNKIYQTDLQAAGVSDFGSPDIHRFHIE